MQAADWHALYLEQAQWTKLLRQYILNNLPIQPNWMVCEFGCGTGAVLQDLSGTFGHAVGLDLDLNVLSFQDTGKPFLVNANAYNPLVALRPAGGTPNRQKYAQIGWLSGNIC
jgi:SAM-dependent methyltransferase